ncbi:MAG: redox-regulated ATPase YchF [Acidobacteria bacterium]|nr:redox-regulated ATPase YchF [Acidobacteriota bacterium]
MKTGIVGLRRVGKTTLFNIITGAAAPTGPGGKVKAHLGVAAMPDERLDYLGRLYEPRKITAATAQFVDMPGVEPDEMKESAYLTGLRLVDALVHVVRTFRDETVPHPASTVDPGRDAADMELEMILADLFQAERRLEKLDKDLRKVKDKDLLAEQAVLQRVREFLAGERPLRELTLSPDEEKRIRGFTFLSRKPLLLVLNMDEADVAYLGTAVDHFGLTGWRDRTGVALTGVCGKIEEEFSRLTPEDARTFMDDLGIPEPGLHRLLRENYRLLGLITFFTVGKDEVRAWTVRRGTTAPEAAGTIHSDLEKGFIRAEIAAYDQFVACGSMPALKERGLLRLEGRDYVVQDGDIMLVRFNV